MTVPAGNGADDTPLPLQLVQDAPGPDGMLAPLFHDLGMVEAAGVVHGQSGVPMHRMDAGDSSHSTAFGSSVQGGRDQGLQQGVHDGEDRRHVSGHRDGLNLPRDTNGPFGYDAEACAAGGVVLPAGVNAFWSPEQLQPPRGGEVTEEKKDINADDTAPQMKPVTLQYYGMGISGNETDSILRNLKNCFQDGYHGEWAGFYNLGFPALAQSRHVMRHKQFRQTDKPHADYWYQDTEDKLTKEYIQRHYDESV